jgi:peptidyl-prolyl cis-trans isomerase SurA
MIKLKLYISLIMLTFFFNTTLYPENNVFIKYKIEDVIITNTDIENEAKYLIALSPQLKTMSEKKILEIAETSIIRETVKQYEVKKYFKLDQKNPLIERFIEDFYLRLNLSNKQDFINYLENQGMDIKEVEKKIEIENNWNILIYEKYKDLVVIDEDLLIKKIKDSSANKETISYLLSEISIEKDQGISLDEKLKKIKDSIDSIGFKNTANLYSISDSAKFGGNIGWILKDRLSKILLEKISKVKVGEITTPTQIGNFFLILKLEEIKKEKVKIDFNKALETLREYEVNRLLNQYSRIYYNKIKINLNISEL